MTAAAQNLAYIQPAFAHLGRARSLEWLEEHGVIWNRDSSVLPSIILGVYRRMSTPGQATGYRQLTMVEDMTDTVLSLGPSFGVIVFDEGQRSGQVLAKRKVAMAMIRALDAGTLDGIATPDAKRLSRNEYLGGGREIVSTVRRRKAMLVLGRGDVVNLRNYRERKFFERELREASDEIGEIRQTFYSGIAARMRMTRDGQVEPMFRGPAPYGYRHVECLDANGEVIRSRGVARRTLAKYDADAPGMTRMIELLNREMSLNMVARILNREGYGRRVHKGAYSKGWTSQRLRGILQSPIHHGIWQAVRDKQSDLWDDFDEEADIVVSVPHLAYWTKAQADSWLDKFTPAVAHRQRTYKRPFARILACSSCGAAMVSAGYHGYRCRRDTPQRQGMVSGMCADPQVLSAQRAEQCLRDLFAKVIPVLARDVVAEHERQAATAAHDPITRELADLDSQEAALIELVKAGGMSERLKQQFAHIQQRRVLLQERQEQRQAMAQINADQLQLLDDLRQDPTGVYSDFEPGEQAEVWRLLGMKVRIARIGGRGWNTRYEAEAVESLNDRSIWKFMSYVTQRRKAA
jgi:hypothetical protein